MPSASIPGGASPAARRSASAPAPPTAASSNTRSCRRIRTVRRISLTVRPRAPIANTNAAMTAARYTTTGQSCSPLYAPSKITTSATLAAYTSGSARIPRIHLTRRFVVAPGMVHHITLHGPPSPRGRPAFWNRPAVATRAAYPICVTSQQWVVTLSCPDTPGIVSAVSTAIATRGGNITESQQFGDPDTGLFFMRVQFEAGVAEPDLREAFAALAETFAMTWKLDVAGRPMRTIIMVSTTAHCLHDLLFRQRATGLPIRSEERRAGKQSRRRSR